MPQAQAVVQVQTGLQSQVQFSHAQAALVRAVSLVGFVFMDDWVSTTETEPMGGSYTAGEKSGVRMTKEKKRAPLRLRPHSSCPASRRGGLCERQF